MTPDLERELRELRVAWPETPDLAPAVAGRLAAPPPRRRMFARPAWQVGVALAAALIAVVMAVPPARSAILDWLGFGSVRIVREEPQPSRFGSGLALGEPVTLAQARERVGFTPVVPAEVGPPDAVYVSNGRVDFVYRPRPGLPRSGTTGVGLLVTQFRAVATPLIQKSVGGGSRVEPVRVAGDPAFFISGAEHGFAYQPEGSTYGAFEEQRLAGNTLVVDRRDGLLLRLEGELSRDEAVRIAASAR
jgi:hypothetical protein